MRLLSGAVPWVLEREPAGHYHACVTSPPYWGLRDYGLAPSDWPAVEYSPMAGLPPVAVPAMRCALGLEPSPEAYIAHLVLVFRAVRRVLREDGVLWLNLGDSYAANRDKQVTPTKWKSLKQGQPSSVPWGLKPKDLVGIPWRAAFALQADGWYLRSDVIWAKPNPMPESVSDRPTKAHEYLFILTKSLRYFWDADAVRERAKDPEDDIRRILGDRRKTYAQTHQNSRPSGAFVGDTTEDAVRNRIAAGRNIRTVWTMATLPSRVAHFAVMTPRLAERCVKASTSERGCCPSCGAPWVRQVERNQYSDRPGSRPLGTRGNQPSLRAAVGQPQQGGRYVETNTLGWSPSCSCAPAAPVPCRVLDPFGGSGTTAHVADVLGRSATLCEQSAAYAALVEPRRAEVQRALAAKPKGARPRRARCEKTEPLLETVRGRAC